jgi:hypothetical protein
MAAVGRVKPLTRVEQTYEQLRNDVPQLKQLPSVIIQLIAEYGPPSLWIVYVSGTHCHVLYPAPVIDAIDARTTGGRSRSVTPLDWSDGWQQLPIQGHQRCIIPQIMDCMKYKEWSFDEWLIFPEPYKPKVYHIPHDQPVTKVWTYPIPYDTRLAMGEHLQPIWNEHCIWRSDTG